MFHSMAFALAAAAALNVGNARAEDDPSKGKGGKPTAAAPQTIQIDLSKLPPDLAKALLKFAMESKPAEAPKPKQPPVAEAPKPKQPPAAKDAAAVVLPPGLAKKPKDHPGRVHFIENALKKAAPAAPSKGTPTPPTPKKKEKSDQDD